MMVKICGITRREDAEAAAMAGADAIGFIFYAPSPRYVTPERAAELGNSLAPMKVGVFVNETAASIETTMRTARLDVAQIYAGETPQAMRIWKAFRIEAAFDPSAVKDAEAVLLDGPKNGTKFDWTHIRASGAAPCAAKIILAGGLTPQNVAEAIHLVRPWGVDASSSLETVPGLKDPEKIRRFVETARKASQ